MQFNRSDSYTLCNNLPRLSTRECMYDIDDVPIKETEEYSIIRFSSLYDMGKYNNLTIHECLDCIQNNINKPLVLVVNENRMVVNESYRLSALQESKSYNMQLERSAYSFSDILNECILSDIENNSTANTDLLLEALDMSGNPNGQQSTTQKIGNGLDRISANGYAAYNQVGKAGDWVKDQLGGFFSGLAGRAINAMDTPENREKMSDYMGRLAGRSVEKMTKSANDSLAPVKLGLTGGLIGGTLLTGMIASVTKLTSGDNINATGEKAANVINALKTQLGNLSTLQAKAPPQQQGIISRLLQKVKNAIATLGRKMGL